MQKLRDFKCDTCNHVFELFAHDSELLKACLKCNGESYRQLSAPKCFQNTTGRSPSARGRL